MPSRQKLSFYSKICFNYSRIVICVMVKTLYWKRWKARWWLSIPLASHVVAIQSGKTNHVYEAFLFSILWSVQWFCLLVAGQWKRSVCLSEYLHIEIDITIQIVTELNRGIPQKPVSPWQVRILVPDKWGYLTSEDTCPWQVRIPVPGKWGYLSLTSQDTCTIPNLDVFHHCCKELQGFELVKLQLLT